MGVLKFIFLLGINFSIFGFIWGIFMFLVRTFQPAGSQSNESYTYIFRIIKYFLLVSVTANFVSFEATGDALATPDTAHISVAAAVLGLYLLGKFQNRAVLNQISQNPMLSKFMPKVDPKVEMFLLVGSLVYFVSCLLYPQMVNNGLVNWFRESIYSIYETPVIGWIFQIIAFFFLISIIMRGINVIGRILSGQSIMNTPTNGGSFTYKSSGTFFEDDKEEDQDGFSDYEDVTDEEENKEE